MAIAKVSDNNHQYFLKELYIFQEGSSEVEDHPKYAMSIVLEDYIKNADGTKTFSGNVISHFVPEFYLEAVASLNVGNPIKINTIASIQDVIVEYLNEEYSLNVEVI